MNENCQHVAGFERIMSMAYQRPNNGSAKPAGRAPTQQAAAPAAATQGKAARGGQKSAGGGSKPNYDLVALDAEGEIIKENVTFEDGTSKMLSKQIGAIWADPSKESMFVKFEDGTTAKAFKRKES